MGLFTVVTRNNAFQLPATKLIVGLGNVGEDYEKTRHNAGFMAVDAFREAKELPKFSLKKDLHAYISEGQIEDTKLIIAKPTTLMNKSGFSVQQIQNYFELGMDQILVVHDDIDLKFKDVRTKVGGNSAGHNGVKSVDAAIGEDYARIRIGVANEHRKITDAVDYVLKKIPAKELKQLPKIFEHTNELIMQFIDNKPE